MPAILECGDMLLRKKCKRRAYIAENVLTNEGNQLVEAALYQNPVRAKRKKRLACIL
jgi:hypothetical protein